MNKLSEIKQKYVVKYYCPREPLLTNIRSKGKLAVQKACHSFGRAHHFFSVSGML